MSRSSVFLLIFICIGIIGFFGWQYNIHNKLAILPRTCSGPKFTDNGCMNGSACIYAQNIKTTTSLAVPTNREQVLNNISALKDQEGNPIKGTCTAWLDLVIKTQSPLTETNP